MADTLRLIPAHYSTIKQSTLHLYHSVLPFLLSTFTIATVYKDEGGVTIWLFSLGGENVGKGA